MASEFTHLMQPACAESGANELAMNSFLYRALGLPTLAAARPRMFSAGSSVWASALRHLNIRVEVRSPFPPEHLRAIPFILVGNHPHGLLDGLVYGFFCEEVLGRRDFKMMANSIVPKVLPELAGHIIPVDNMSAMKDVRARQNGPAAEAGLALLAQGGLLSILPAGAVSDFRVTSPEGPLRVTDPEWRPTVLRLMAESGRDAVPAHLSGRNGLGFQLASLLGTPAKRLASFRQFLNSKNKTITVTIGAPVSWAALSTRPSTAERLRLLRKRVYALAA